MTTKKTVEKTTIEDNAIHGKSKKMIYHRIIGTSLTFKAQ